MSDYTTSQGIDENKCACNCHNDPKCVAYYFDNAANPSVCGLYTNLGDSIPDSNSNAYIKKASICNMGVECTL